MNTRELIKALGWDRKYGFNYGYEEYKDVLVIWDEDHDKRILRVIDKWNKKQRENVLAIQEHEAGLTVIFKHYKSFDEIDIEHDCFTVCDYYIAYPKTEEEIHQRFICKHTNTRKEHMADETTGEVKKIGIYCSDCGKWIKWESFVDDSDFIMPFGKFKGQKIADIVKNEKAYALWACGNLKGSLKARFARLYDGK